MAINRTDFFDKKSKGALWDVGVSIKRSNPLPLDADSVFASKSDAETYAASVISYPGQVIAVVPESGSAEIYYLDENCHLVPMGSKLVADDKGIVIENGQIKLKGLAGATEGQVLKAKANEDGTITVEWVTDTTAGDASAALNNAKAELLGKDTDAATADTIKGAKKFASDAVNTLDRSLSAVAKTGNASDVAIADAGDKLTSTTVEGALAELVGMIEGVDSANEITIEKSTANGVAARYTFKQGGVAIAQTIDIPKDMVVQSGAVVTIGADEATAERPAGTYIKLVIANADNTELFIPVDGLIEYVTSGSVTTDKIQVTVNAAHKVTAAIKAGSIEKTDFVEGVQTSLGKADTAVQSITTGTVNGNITVDGAQVPVFGLGSAAYTAASAYDVAGAANAVYGAIGRISNESIEAIFATKA